MIFERFRQLCGRMGLLPTSHIISGELIQMAEQPVASGAFSDVWEGTYKGNRVAMKALRVFKDEEVQKIKKVIRPSISSTPVADYCHQVFCKEVVVWKRFSHPNIVPFLGVSEVPSPLCGASEWMPNGNMRDYVGKNPKISRLQFVCWLESALGSD